MVDITYSIPEGQSSVIRTIAVISGKGGTGKTSVVASLGAILAHSGHRTLMVDADFFTNGLSSFLLRATFRQRRFGLYDSLLARVAPHDLSPIEIPHRFYNDNLFLLPATSSRDSFPFFHNDAGPEPFSFDNIYNTVEATIVNALQKDFEYVLIDTRGGGDYPEMATAKAAGAIVLVTEADRVSWDIGDLIIRRLNATAEEIVKLGFVINKNVLPDTEIVPYLNQLFQMPHLATIPLDERAVACFQMNKVPLADDLSAPFNAPLVSVARNLFMSESWTRKQRASFAIIEKRSNDQTEKELRTNNRRESTQSLRWLIQIYVTFALLIATLIDFQLTRPLIGIAALILFIISLSDLDMLQRFVNRKKDGPQ